jgi:hypothetical protein
MSPPLVADRAYLLAPPSAAQELPEYPQFIQTRIPHGSNAVRAWTGTTQPFIDAAAARRFLHCIEHRMPFDVIEGTIDAHPPTGAHHWADPWIVHAETQFQLLVLEFEGKEHPRAHSVTPEISRNMHPLHPHLRDDKLVRFGQRLLPALCIYSGATFQYSAGTPRIVQFIDQATAYIGRHIIWMNTRLELPQRFGDAFRTPDPGELIFGHASTVRADPRFVQRRRQEILWDGYWPGEAAPSGAANHLKFITPSQDCWCCSGKKYGECHRPLELKLVHT